MGWIDAEIRRFASLRNTMQPFGRHQVRRHRGVMQDDAMRRVLHA